MGGGGGGGGGTALFWAVKDLDRGRKCLNRLYGSDTPLGGSTSNHANAGTWSALLTSNSIRGRQLYFPLLVQWSN